jgi:anti-sigma B factor antagonist
MQPPRIVKQRLDGSRWVVGLEGEHDVSTAPELETAVRDSFETGTRVVVDLSGAEFIDSSILSVLARCHQLAAHDEELVVVVAPESHASRLFELTAAADFLPTFPSRAAALNAYRSVI